jgi:hypothetical protein
LERKKPGKKENCAQMYRQHFFARTSFSFHESAKKTGIKLTFLLLLKFHSQVYSKPKLLP